MIDEEMLRRGPSQHGLLAPFRRDRKRDFASGRGPALLKSKILQVLLTQGSSPHASGELPWRTRFGASLNTLRHQRNDAQLEAMARVYLRDALAQWLPTVKLLQVTASRDGATLSLSLRVRDTQEERDLSVEVAL